MTNTKAIIVLFRAFFLSQCKFFKKHEFIYTTVYGVAAALIIGIKKLHALFNTSYTFRKEHKLFSI